MMKNYQKFFAITCMYIFFLLSSTCSLLAQKADKKTAMKILMVVGSFPVIHDICVLNQITGLIDRGHDVHIFAFSKGDCTNVQKDVIQYNLINKTTFKKLPSNVHTYDIVMFQFGHRIFDIKKQYKFKGKVVVCLRGYDITVFLNNNPHAYDAYFDRCDLFMPVCEAFKKTVEAIGCPSHKIVVQHSAIDCSKFKFKLRELPQHGTITIVSSGRFIEKKGFEYVIRAIAQLVEKYPCIHYMLIGDGALKGEYEKLIKELDIEDKVTLHGWCTHDDYIALLDRAHIFVLPSVTAKNNDQEGIPNVLKEAMAMGLLTVATDHSGNGELIEDGITGFLIPERDVAAISQAIDYVVTHQDQWSSIQVAAVHKIRREFDKEKENDRLEALLYDLVKKK
jgi:colanic acid/amylovoran biosynthesis glycosyltransferase